MKVLLDTSVLVAALVESHPSHSRALPWVQRARSGDVSLYVATHSLAELYAVLTALPVSPRISPGLCLRVIRQSVEPLARMVSLTASEYRRVLSRSAELGISGGSVYDALIAWAAYKARVNRLITLDPQDFLRVWPEGGDKVTTP